jgi:hypothetical protein
MKISLQSSDPVPDIKESDTVIGGLVGLLATL